MIFLQGDISEYPISEMQKQYLADVTNLRVTRTIVPAPRTYIKSTIPVPEKGGMTGLENLGVSDFSSNDNNPTPTPVKQNGNSGKLIVGISIASLLLKFL